MELKIDDNITKFVLDNTNLFENIHPNIVTSVGLICNYFIFKSIHTNSIKSKELAILFGVRWLVDCLDGGIARKYNKKSKLGNLLDGFSDIMFMGMIFYAILLHFNLPLWYFIFFILFIVLLEKYYNISESHEKLKNKNDNMFHNMFVFFTNNSFISFIIIYYLLVNKFKN